MPHCPQTTRSLPFLSEFPDGDRQSAEKAFERYEKRRRKGAETVDKAASDAIEDFRRRLRDLVGAGNLAAVHRQRRHEHQVLRELMQPPGGLDRDLAKLRKASRRKIDALVRKLGIDPKRLQKLHDEFRESFDELLTSGDGKVVRGHHLAGNLDQWTRLSPLHALPLPWGILPPPDDPTDPHRWFLFRPPFFGFLFGFSPQTSDNFRVDHQLILHPPSGLVGNEATMDCDDAGSFDYASVTAEAQIAFGFVAPATGLVEVLVDAQSTIATHALEIEDEFGSSEAWCNQNNYLMMNVLHPNVPEPSLALMSNLFRESDGDDLSASQENLIRAQHYFAQLYSAGPVSAGQHVVITVGTRTFDKARANDMELHSRSDFQWFINSVEVRIAP